MLLYDQRVAVNSIIRSKVPRKLKNIFACAAIGMAWDYSLVCCGCAGLARQDLHEIRTAACDAHLSSHAVTDRADRETSTLMKNPLRSRQFFIPAISLTISPMVIRFGIQTRICLGIAHGKFQYFSINTI